MPRALRPSDLSKRLLVQSESFVKPWAKVDTYTARLPRTLLPPALLLYQSRLYLPQLENPEIVCPYDFL